MRVLGLTIILLSSLYVTGQPIFQAIDLESDTISGFSILDETDADLYMTGEMHNYWESNGKLQLAAIRHLSERKGLKDILLEFGPSSGYYITEFINTQSDDMDDEVRSNAREGYANYLFSLKEYNLSLPEERRLTIHGIDIERGRVPAARLMSRILPQTPPPVEISTSISTIKALGGYIVKFSMFYGEGYGQEEVLSNPKLMSIKQSMDAVVKDYFNNKEIFKAYFGESAEKFDKIFNGLKELAEWESLIKKRMLQQAIHRENVMFSNLMELKRKMPERIFFGQFGRCHVAKSEQEESECEEFVFRSLVARIRLEGNNEFPRGVCAMACVYPKSGFEESSNLYTETIREYYKLVPKNKVGITRIDALIEDQVLQENFDYLIINNIIEKPGALALPGRTKTHLYLGVGGINQFDISSQVSTIFNYTLSNSRPNQGLSFYYGASAFQTSVSEVLFNVILPKRGIFLGNGKLGEIGSWNLHSKSGFDFTKSSKFNLITFLGLGYGQTKLRSIEPSDQNGPLGEKKYYRYINDQILISSELHMDYAYKMIGLAFKAGYQIDLSKKTWVSDRVRLMNAPLLKHSGYYLVASLFFNFNLQI